MTDRQPRSMRDRETIMIAGERLIYTIRRSRRAKRLVLSVDEQGQVEVVIPWRIAERHAATFIRDKEAWLSRHLKKRVRRPRQPAWHTGSQLPYLGQQLTLMVTRDEQRRRATVARRGDTLEVALPARGLAKPVLAAWYRRQARIFFTEQARAVAERIGVKVQRIAIGNHTSQWGSATPRGRLSFNWRLLLGPTAIAQYVVVHEVAHLVHHNHSDRYWTLVGQLYPSYKEARRWLREHAGELAW